MNRHAFPGVRLAIAGIFVFSAGMACAAPVDRDQLERELRAAQAIEKQSPGKAEALLVDEALAALAAVDAPNAPDGAPAQSGGILTDVGSYDGGGKGKKSAHDHCPR